MLGEVETTNFLIAIIYGDLTAFHAILGTLLEASIYTIYRYVFL